mmetsp:Transcript_8421/g.29954  ORF Transcript_8421/g.29954 Transcript_8421/m.29954 type:complete len:220 (+) Transcript_8421:1176-1835(+)
MRLSSPHRASFRLDLVLFPPAVRDGRVVCLNLSSSIVHTWSFGGLFTRRRDDVWSITSRRRNQANRVGIHVCRAASQQRSKRDVHDPRGEARASGQAGRAASLSFRHRHHQAGRRAQRRRARGARMWHVRTRRSRVFGAGDRVDARRDAASAEESNADARRHRLRRVRLERCDPNSIEGVLGGMGSSLSTCGVGMRGRGRHDTRTQRTHVEPIPIQQGK